MGHRKISNEEKTAVMTAVQAYLDQGWTLNSAYNQVKADFLSEEKTIPAEMTVRRWFAGARTDTDGNGVVRIDTENAGTDEAARDPEDAPGIEVTIPPPHGPGEPEPEGPEGPQGETLELDNYTRRLELICRLYRTRAENAIDAVCDELLPELFTEEN